MDQKITITDESAEHSQDKPDENTKKAPNVDWTNPKDAPERVFYIGWKKTGWIECLPGLAMSLF